MVILALYFISEAVSKCVESEVKLWCALFLVTSL